MMRLLFVISIVSVIAVTNGFHIEPRVINGDISNPADYPFYVYLSSEQIGFGGGSLISDR